MKAASWLVLTFSLLGCANDIPVYRFTPQQWNDVDRHEHQAAHCYQVVGEIGPVGFERLGGNGDIADRAGVGGVEAHPRGPERNGAAADEEVGGVLALCCMQLATKDVLEVF